MAYDSPFLLLPKRLVLEGRIKPKKLPYLFLGNPESLPCGDGSIDDPSNVVLLDANADGTIDLTHAIYMLTWLFLGGPEHEQGIRCIAIDACPDSNFSSELPSPAVRSGR